MRSISLEINILNEIPFNFWTLDEKLTLPPLFQLLTPEIHNKEVFENKYFKTNR